jgi:ubiquinone/menaquinone biosynthesis C-methylase UbiE
VSDPVAAARWRAAQRLELDFWLRWQKLPPWKNLNIPKYWREEVAHFGETWGCFRGLRVLDVGCGPFGLIHFADHAAERIRVDPLLPQYSQRLPLKGWSLCAMAESLPLANRSIDLAVCFNALDHMRDPEAALEEIARVLRPGGAALLMIHTFPAWLWPLFRFDRMHPHHYTEGSFASIVRSHFRIDRCETVSRHFDTSAGKWWMPSVWKYMAAGVIVSSTYVRASSPGFGS